MREIKTCYVSSLAFLGSSAEEMMAIAEKHKWPLEFSSGLPYRPDMVDVYLSARVTKMLHNYFPAPEVPFVLNLASKDNEIRRRSVLHCLNCLELSRKTNAPFFAAHAGFCIDPKPEELGRRITYEDNFDREEHFAIFLESVTEILSTAERLNTDFLIENNVIAAFNLTDRGTNPLLCCEHKEIARLVNDIDNPRLGLLLDTAHLKVSCQSLGLQLDQELEKILPYVRGIHHSDNDGTVDDNRRLDQDYWFLPFMKKTGHLVHVLEVKSLSPDEVLQQLNILRSNGY